MPHPEQEHNEGKMISEEIVLHAKPQTGGRDQPTVYVPAQAKIQLWELDPNGVHGPMIELRIVHPRADELTEVLRFSSEKDATEHRDAIINALASSVQVQSEAEQAKVEEEVSRLAASLQMLQS